MDLAIVLKSDRRMLRHVSQAVEEDVASTVILIDREKHAAVSQNKAC